MKDKSKIKEEEFVRQAILKLRGKYKGIHTVYSGFNQAFKQYYGKNPIEATQKLAEDGKISIRPVKGGVMIYLSEDLPKSSITILDEILGEDSTTLEEKPPDDNLEIIGPAEEEEKE